MHIWMGTGEALSAYLATVAKFDQAYAPRQEPEENEVDPLFGVDISSIGLPYLEKFGNTAVLTLAGSMVNSHSWWHPYAVGHVVSYDAMKDAVNILVAAQDVSRVIVRIESGGGMVSGLDSTAKYMRKLMHNKSVIVHTDTAALSAAYWLASSFPRIAASPMAQIGNIGTMALIPDLSGMYDKMGVKFHLFKAGKQKGYGISETEFTEEEKAFFQSHVEKSNNFFLTHVSTHRNLMMSETDKWAEAQSFFAGEAKAVGLVDEVATLEELIGSLTASTNNGESTMPISAEKLAQIQAGAAPETVLTQAELATYMASLTVADEPAVEPEKPSASTTVTEPTTAEAPKTDFNMARELGRAEAKNELLESQLADQQAKNESMKAQIDGLMVVAQAAVQNLQTALQLPKEVKASAAGITAQFNELKTKMESRFPSGRVSSSTAETQEPVMSAHVPHPFRPY